MTVMLLGLSYAWILASCTETAPTPQPSTQPSLKAQENRTVIDKERLASLVRPLDDQLADMIKSPQTRIEVIPTPFFASGSIYKVTHLLPTRPVVFTVGQSGDFAVLLASNPPGYVELARRAQVKLATAPDAIGYVTTLLETTRSFAHRFEIITDVAQIKPRPNLSAEDSSRFSQIVERHKAAVRAPMSTGTGPWDVTVVALRKQALVQFNIAVEIGGAIQVSEKVLAEDLSIPYTL